MMVIGNISMLLLMMVILMLLLMVILMLLLMVISMLLLMLVLLAAFIWTWSVPCRPRGQTLTWTWTWTSCAPWSGSWASAWSGGAGSWTGSDDRATSSATYAPRASVRCSSLRGPCCQRSWFRRGPWRRPWRHARPPSQRTRNQEVVWRPSCCGWARTWRRRPRGHTSHTRQTGPLYRFCSLCPNRSGEPFQNLL